MIRSPTSHRLPRWGFAPLVARAAPRCRASTVKELIGLARARPEMAELLLNGSGRITYVAPTIRSVLAAPRITEVTYKGAGPYRSAFVFSGEVRVHVCAARADHVLTSRTGSFPGHRDARMTSARRFCPGIVPTIAESGLRATPPPTGTHGGSARHRAKLTVSEPPDRRHSRGRGRENHFSALGYEATPARRKSSAATSCRHPEVEDSDRAGRSQGELMLRLALRDERLRALP